MPSTAVSALEKRDNEKKANAKRRADIAARLQYKATEARKLGILANSVFGKKMAEHIDLMIVACQNEISHPDAAATSKLSEIRGSILTLEEIRDLLSTAGERNDRAQDALEAFRAKATQEKKDAS